MSDRALRFGDQLQAHLERLTTSIGSKINAIERQYREKLRAADIDKRAAGELLRITPGAAVRCYLEGEGLLEFLKQSEAAGRRLAKLNLAPDRIVQALDEYDAIISSLVRVAGPEKLELQAARQQMLFCIILSINEAYYHVREVETNTFHQIFRIELEARNMDVLYRRFVEILVEAFGSRAGHIFILDSEQNAWRLKASSATGVSNKALAVVPNGRRLTDRLSFPRLLSSRAAPELLDPGWAKQRGGTWSFPMKRNGQLAGVIQLAFETTEEWFPRDEELVNAASERCLIAAERAKRVESLAIREEHIRSLADRMLLVEEIERRRMSRELHDDAGQALVTIRLQMEMIEMSLPANCEEVATKLAEVRDVTEKTILDMRRLIADLSPVVLEQFGLEAAVRQLVKRLQNVRRCTVKLVTQGLEQLPSKIQMIVYRIVQECCTNVGKHSNATNVNISITSADGVLSLEVRDNGCGFRVDEALSKADSFGLMGIRERVALLGGKFEIESRPKETRTTKAGKKRGTEVRIELPLAVENSWQK